MTQIWNEGPERTFVFAASTNPFLRMKINSSGEAAIAGAGEDDVGVAASGYSAAEYGTVRLRKSSGTTVMIASGAISVGASVYPAASGKVSATKIGRRRGICLTAASADGDQIEVLEVEDNAGVVFADAMVATPANISSTASETDFATTISIPAGLLQAGDVIEVDFGCKATGTNSTDTFTYKVYVGGSVVLATGAVDLADGDAGCGRVSAVVRTTGATGTMVSDGTSVLKTTASATSLDSATLDTTGAVVVKVSATHSSNNAGNISELRALNVRVVRKSA